MQQGTPRILIIRPSALGDVCRTVPVVASLRRAYPQARIDWLVQDAFAPAIEAHPSLTEVVPFARAELGRMTKSGRLGPALGFCRAIRRRKYDLVFDVQGLARSGLFAWATGAARRIGFSDAREGGWLGLNERYLVHANHTVDRMLGVLELAGVPAVRDMTLYSPAGERQSVASDIRFKGRFIVVAPTSRWPAKRWPTARFAELVKRILKASDTNIVLVGAASEHGQCSEVTGLANSEPRVIDLVGKTSVGALMAVVESAAMVIANDSAVLHMAVGFNRPLVALFGPTSIEKVGPYLRNGDVLQHVFESDCLDHKNEQAGQELMSRISAEEVFAAVMERLT